MMQPKLNQHLFKLLIIYQIKVIPIIFWDAPPTIVATAQESCTMRHFQPFLCQWCPPQCQTCRICQNLSKMKVQHLENICQN